MTLFRFKGLLQQTGWLSPAVVAVDENGLITSISETTSAAVDHDLDCYALPGFQNAHSHAFQYAMAGLAETHSTSHTPDDFWSWREAMYKLALSIDPDQLEAIAAMLYAEMLRHGYTRVAEFHYVHHDKNGAPYSNLAEMGERLVSAAKTAGIGITLVPIFYQKGGFGKAPAEGQRRFISADQEAYLKLVEASEKACTHYTHANVALGVHSMRGVEPEAIRELALSGPQDKPFHIHISEQLKEVEDCLAYLRKRPVQWMLENIGLSDRFHLVHATHLAGFETEGIARSGAHVVLCPSTEGNLGDGIFPLLDFHDFGGSWSIGTDSHIGLNPFEELRILDYGQRLTSHRRNIFYSGNEGDAGKFAIDRITRAGRKAMNNNFSGFFEVGQPLDAALVDAGAPLIRNTALDNLCSTMVYASDASMQRGVISGGRLIDARSEHLVGIRERFEKSMTQLGNRL